MDDQSGPTTSMVGMTTVATIVGDGVVSLVLYGIGGAVIATALGRRRAEA